MTEEYGHISDAFDNLPEEELLMTHEEMLKEAANREALEALSIELDKEIEHGYRKERILERYNNFYNIECSGLAHGTPITPEFQQAMTLECMLDALRCENMNHEFDVISTDDINDLINGLYQQGKDYLERYLERVKIND